MKTKLLIASLASLCVFASAGNAQEVVLQEVSAAVTLSAWLKFADRASDVDFEVIQPSGTVSKATAVSVHNGDRAGHVTYPTDFTNAGMHPGTYKWTATVNGKVITSGVFKYVAAKKGMQVYVPD